MEKSILFANDLIEFINNSPNQYYCIKKACDLLEKNGFKRIDEKDSWNLKPKDKFFTVRHDSALIAAVVGEKNICETGLRIIGSHTDSPALKLKPKFIKMNENFVQLGVEVYGGPMLSTWTDRELGINGKIIIKNKNNYYESKFFCIDEPLLVIPQLAIHYNREANSGLALNPQTQMLPILTLSDKEVTDSILLNLIAKNLKINQEEIINYEIYLHPSQKGGIAGLNKDFIMSARIDNQSMVHASLNALIANKDNFSMTQIVACYDNEEVGSSTTNGGNSSFTMDFLKRLNIALGNNEEAYYRTVANSFYMSADGAHALHPNYSEKFDNINKVFINKGPVIKINASTAYASTVESSAFFQLVCQKTQIPYQKFVNRSDIRGGGTIGSMIATNIGIKTVDIGNAMMAMHSARELCGVKDHYFMYCAMKEFLVY